MDTVIDSVGEHVYSMFFNHCMLAPINITVNGKNVNEASPLSISAAIYRDAYEAACSEAGVTGTVCYTDLECAQYVRSVLIYVKANEVKHAN